MPCHDTGKASESIKGNLRIAIAGNPNCGKSALFNSFTGIRQKTGNWPGVTVDRKEGHFQIDDRQVTAIDLPGIYSLDANSLDEQVTRDYLLSRDADLIVNVIDASNLERNLYMTVQLLEMGVPLIVSLNMMDIARKRGIDIDITMLSRELGCPVVPIVATSGEGISELKARMLDVVDNKVTGGYSLAFDETIESAASELSGMIEHEHAANRRWLAIKLLENDAHATASVSDATREQATHLQQQIQVRNDEDADVLIADSRFGHAHTLARSVLKHRSRITRTMSDRIDQFVLGKWSGIPLFLVIMYLMFLFTINFGGAFIDFFDGIAGAIFVDGLGELLTSLGSPAWLRVALADGIGGGIQIVSTFIPIIASLYLFLSLLEDSGYMSRAAFVMDRAMRAIGLPGKAFVPLIVGFGCNVPAIMATRTLEHERERKLTILMNPFMSCGARLPVYALFAAAFFPHSGQDIVFLLYIAGIAVAILTGLLMKKTLLPGESSGFMMELPSYHMPSMKGVLLRAWDRVSLFIREAGQVIIVMVLALNLLNSIGTDGSFGNENSEESVLSEASKQITPLFAPMGIQDDNWPAIVGILSGVLAKEVVVGTLDTLYTQIGQKGMPETEFDFWQSVNDAAATVPDNLAGLAASVADPLGLDIGNLDDHGEAAASQGVRESVFGAMNQRFDGQAGAFAYLLFILLYFPCVATIGAIKREAGRKWAAFVAFWTTSVAYLTASSYYQLATYADHPQLSIITLSLMWMLFLLLIIGLRYWGRKVPASAAVVDGSSG
ncbi:Fe(2+) transporter permease subunit FeoB [Solemya velum gill symbiont]|uniref:Fe(2+) transporter permease subunit FeoB n=1 Tax=Solemya velum gill symbiont TaxID=2340 RepID=UPI000997DEF5|nr:Fe(2+) transporter permease subunit FeoB [Solemya velum gill symbiont]OOY98838.1 ferrous iron transport protein B [Solemya velum gill symbiont]OOZ01123.1 ferrous iron transport protein B [Solemya velum gill symbiont]OOZ03320.1 ferrous iron transport protein B [Solemya velum gill symbiont]OOZ05577.1 ferrous iron transport protein B [Solemya velum gill symbiont]OOZ07810.1 ferrous iron transport protein B [Solemya velum gill symbiont]